MLYTIIAEYKPKNYIETGSGTTTKIAHMARKGAGLDFTCAIGIIWRTIF